jgi:hypothetical protein
VQQHSEPHGARRARFAAFELRLGAARCAAAERAVARARAPQISRRDARDHRRGETWIVGPGTCCQMQIGRCRDRSRDTNQDFGQQRTAGRQRAEIKELHDGAPAATPASKCPQQAPASAPAHNGCASSSATATPRDRARRTAPETTSSGRACSGALIAARRFGAARASIVAQASTTRGSRTAAPSLDDRSTPRSDIDTVSARTPEIHRRIGFEDDAQAACRIDGAELGDRRGHTKARRVRRFELASGTSVAVGGLASAQIDRHFDAEQKIHRGVALESHRS